MELNDDDMLDFLMTSDFVDDYSPSILKDFLVKWKYFYRLQNGRKEKITIYSEGEIERLSNLSNGKDIIITELFAKNVDKDNLINEIKNRKLTFKERWFGKIILK
jgi:hypothetical protein